ncbi:PLDc_N domain-containing protein [Leucobacter insecticola]|uniref:PLDc_N domain-containing protein n=1 Tax=Leucobacter insecticola TaxID=2714934 RepID=A0A6G8FGZ9_9MICO|nr:PLD nuclease N-terminal domain-containing protein [Leucobacter insecticola]QIM15740.1 PLDc_N domain-containing protein [Leucobacter insecticola]
MVRFLIIGIVIAVAFTLFALVDAAMTDGARARGVSKPVWVVLIVLLPVIGGVLWFMIGKGATPAKRPTAPDDDPRFSGNRMSTSEVEVHLKDLEARLRELDDEVYPGEEVDKPSQDPAPQTDPDAPAAETQPGSEAKPDSDTGAAQK